MPRCTYVVGHSGSPLEPASPTRDPSATGSPFATDSSPRWVSDTASPSAVWMVTVLPCVGTVPANETVPAAGASTCSPVEPDTSMPRCWPAAYGSGPSE